MLGSHRETVVIPANKNLVTAGEISSPEFNCTLLISEPKIPSVNLHMELDSRASHRISDEHLRWNALLFSLREERERSVRMVLIGKTAKKYLSL